MSSDENEIQIENVKIGVKNPYTEHLFKVELSVQDTILQLKQNIHENHPGNPKVEDQKLIFGGKVHENGKCFSDILTHHDLTHLQIFHLVLPQDVQKRIVDFFNKAKEAERQLMEKTEKGSVETAKKEETKENSSSNLSSDTTIEEPANVRTSGSFGNSGIPFGMNQPFLGEMSGQQAMWNQPLGFAAGLGFAFGNGEIDLGSTSNPMLRNTRSTNTASTDDASNSRLNNEMFNSKEAIHKFYDQVQTATRELQCVQISQMMNHMHMQMNFQRELIANLPPGSLPQGIETPLNGTNSEGERNAGNNNNNAPAQNVREYVLVIDVKLIIKLLFAMYIFGQGASTERFTVMAIFAIIFYLYRTGALRYFGIGRAPNVGNGDGGNENNNGANANPGNNNSNGIFTRIGLDRIGRVPTREQENRFLTGFRCVVLSFVMSILPFWEVEGIPEVVNENANPVEQAGN